MLLLCGSALALTSLWRLTHVDPGFRAENVVTMRLLLQGGRYSGRSTWPSASAPMLLARLADIPGVVVAGASKRAPLTGGGEPYSFKLVRPDGGVVDTIQPAAGIPDRCAGLLQRPLYSAAGRPRVQRPPIPPIPRP